MQVDFMSIIAIATSLIGFVTVWIKVGHDKGRKEEVIKAHEERIRKNEKDIEDIERKTHGIEIRIAEFMGEIRVKLDTIKETVSELKPKGVKCAAKK